MAQIDQLDILIQADATKAEKAIDGLISSLQTLNNSLDLGNFQHFCNQLKDIAAASRDLKGIGSDIKSIADAGSKLASLTGFKTLNDEVRETEATTKRFAKEFADSMDFGSKKSYKANLEEFERMIGSMFNGFKNGKYTPDRIVNEYGELFGEIKQEVQGAKKEFDETYNSVKHFADTTKLIVDSKTLEDLRKLHDGLDGVRSAIGGFTVNGTENVSNWFKELEEATGKSFRGANFTDKIESLIDYLQNARKRIDAEAGLTQEELSKAYKADGMALAESVRTAYEEMRKETVKNPFDGILKGLQSLQGITLPDFSGISVLANGLKELSGIKVDRIADIANALRGISNVSTDGLNGLANAASAVSKVANEASNTATPMREMARNAQEVGNGVALLVDKMHGFNSFASSMETAAEMFDRIARSFAMNMFEQMNNALANVGANSALPQLESDIIDVTDGFREISSSIEDTRNALVAIDNTGIGDISEAAEVASESFSEIAKSLEPNIGEIKEMQAGIEKFADAFAKSKDYTAKPLADSLDDVAKKAEKAEQKMSALDKYVQRIMNHPKFDMDFRSAGLSDTLTNIQKLSGALSRMQQRPEIFNAGYFEKFSRELDINKRKWDAFTRQMQRRTRLGGAFDDASKEAQKLRDRMEDLKRLMSEMDNGKIGIDVSQYQAWDKELAKITERYNELMGKKKEVEKPSKGIDLLATLVALGHEIGNIANMLDKIGDYGFKGLRLAFRPLDLVIKEYKERIEGLVNAFRNLQERGRKHLQKLSAFWKRSMKTFTFMLVRKAITAILNEINDAVQSLAKWSKMFGTMFNDSMSHITSNLSYIARSIVGAFEPIINAIVPAFNMLADAVANAAARLGEFFAALTGQGYYMQAVKQVTDYAESVEKAHKAQKNLIAGLDDLNIITTPTSTASGMDDVAAQWKKMDVSDGMKNIADQVKDIAKKLFDPIKKAWDNVGDHVKGQFAFMGKNLKKMFGDIGRDWLAVWQEEATQKILEKIFEIIGNIAEGIGWIAKNFNDAWNNAGVGKKILQNIRDIIGIIVGHIHDMSETFVEWAKNIDFNPLLKAFEEFTRKLQPLVDFIGGMFADIWERVILRHWKFVIEKELPHIMETIGRIIDSFDFPDLRKKLQPLLDAFETMRENIETGIVDAIGNLGERIGKFTQSEDFANFLKNIEWFMNQVTAERVEKLFTALGGAILNVSESLIKFVGSEKFRDFIQKLWDWYDSKSAEDIADILTKIAIAIAAFKFTAFVGKGVAEFFKFVSVLQGLKGLGGLGGLIGGSTVSMGAIATTAGVIVGVAAALYSLVNSFGGLNGVLDELSKHFDIIKKSIKDAFEKSGISDSIKRLKDAFDQLLESLGNQKSLWQVLFYLIDGLVALAVNIAIPIIQGAITILTGLCEVISGVLDLVGGLFDVLKGFFTGDSELIAEGARRMGEGIYNAFKGFIDLIVGEGGLMSGFVQGVFNFFKWLKHVLIGDPIVIDMVNGILEWFSTLLKDGLQFIGDLVDGAVQFFTNLKDDAIELAKEMKEKVIEKAKEMKEKVVAKVQEMKEKALSKITELKNQAVSKFNAMKEEATAKFNELKNNVVGAVNNLKNDAISAFTQLKNDAVGLANQTAEDVSHGFWDMVDWASDAFWGVVNAAGDILSNVPSRISSALSGVGSAITGAFNGVFGTMQSIGSDIVNGLSRGITSNNSKNIIQRAMDTVTGWGSQRFTSSAYGWGIASPSKLTEEWGKYIVEGLNLGITENAKSTVKSIDKWFDMASSVKVPQFDIESAIPKNNLSADVYSHSNLTMGVDNSGIEESVRAGVSEVIGGLLLPIMRDIAESSRETANKKLTIGTDAVGRAAQQYARNYQMRTGRNAYSAT